MRRGGVIGKVMLSSLGHFSLPCSLYVSGAFSITAAGGIHNKDCRGQGKRNEDWSWQRRGVKLEDKGR